MKLHLPELPKSKYLVIIVFLCSRFRFYAKMRQNMFVCSSIVCTGSVSERRPPLPLFRRAPSLSGWKNLDNINGFSAEKLVNACYLTRVFRGKMHQWSEGTKKRERLPLFRNLGTREVHYSRLKNLLRSLSKRGGCTQLCLE